jgi:sedoheptulokinase
MHLGIDIGTTKAAAVICAADGRVLAAAAREHRAGSPRPGGRCEQDTAALLAAMRRAVRDLPARLRSRVCGIGVTGQMHGVLILDDAGRALTPLINWQDQRCIESPAFLPGLTRRTGHSLRTGYGGATLAWLAARRALPRGAAAAGTIHDIAVMTICGATRPVIDPTDAASWGLFDPAGLQWDSAAVKAARIPDRLLPVVVPCGAEAGSVCAAEAAALGIPEGIPVTAAIGDNQASMLATLGDPATDLGLTLGTGAQVSAVMDVGPARRAAAGCATCECRPFPGGRTAVVAASLCGGAAWAWLADAVLAWMRDLGMKTPSRDRMFAMLNELGMASRDEVEVHPQFLGERHDPALTGRILGLTMDNFRLGAVARGLARGIVRNLRGMLPPAALRGRRRVVGSGNALRRVPLLQAMVREEFGLPLALSPGREEAATGAARLAADHGSGAPERPGRSPALQRTRI